MGPHNRRRKRRDTPTRRRKNSAEGIKKTDQNCTKAERDSGLSFLCIPSPGMHHLFRRILDHTGRGDEKSGRTLYFTASDNIKQTRACNQAGSHRKRKSSITERAGASLRNSGGRGREEIFTFFSRVKETTPQNEAGGLIFLSALSVFSTSSYKGKHGAARGRRHRCRDSGLTEAPPARRF